MIITIATDINQKEYSDPDILNLLNSLHASGLTGLYYEFDNNNNLIIHVENTALTRKYNHHLTSDSPQLTAALAEYFKPCNAKITGLTVSAFIPPSSHNVIKHHAKTLLTTVQKTINTVTNQQAVGNLTSMLKRCQSILRNHNVKTGPIKTRMGPRNVEKEAKQQAVKIEFTDALLQLHHLTQSAKDNPNLTLDSTQPWRNIAAPQTVIDGRFSAQRITASESESQHGFRLHLTVLHENQLNSRTSSSCQKEIKRISDYILTLLPTIKNPTVKSSFVYSGSNALISATVVVQLSTCLTIPMKDLVAGMQRSLYELKLEERYQLKSVDVLIKKPELQLTTIAEKKVKMHRIKTDFFRSHQACQNNPWKVHPGNEKVMIVLFKESHQQQARSLKQQLCNAGLHAYCSPTKKGKVGVSVNLIR